MSTRKIGLLVSLVLVIAASLWGGVLAQDAPACEGETLEAARELGTIYIRALNAGDLNPWYEVLADDYRAHYSTAGFAPMDKDQARADDEALMAALTDFNTVIDFTTVSADCRFVTFRWTSTATFTGPLGGFEPTGQTGQVSGTTIVELADGQIVEEWVAYDFMTYLLSVGAMGGMAEAPGGLTAEIAADFVTRFDAVINEDLNLASDLFHEDFAGHLPFGPELTRDGWIAYAEMIKASFPDIKQTTNFSFHTGDKLVVHVTYNATFSGQPFFGAEPTGAPIVMNGIGIFRFEDGQPVENFAVLDVGELFAQIGLVTPPAPAE
jgi:predicted ester cyclase